MNEELLMKKELDDLLCERYPALFSERHMSIEESAMAWGLTCGDGWFDLIDAFCAEVQHAVQHGHMPPVVLKQVKEKFGSLRIRYRGGDDVTEGLVRMATAMSERLCEICGHPGETGRRPRDQMPVMTRCCEHMKPGYGADDATALPPA
ncbi:MAG: hypothetical protein F9K47_11965 [Burkholderiales bacterium]|nr:MAG: hypothetical protein F9K47_11965 [Burkholderiales bacterium]